MRGYSIKKLHLREIQGDLRQSKHCYVAMSLRKRSHELAKLVELQRVQYSNPSLQLSLKLRKQVRQRTYWSSSLRKKPMAMKMSPRVKMYWP